MCIRDRCKPIEIIGENSFLIHFTRLRLFSAAFGLLALAIAFYIGYTRITKKQPALHLLYSAIITSVPMFLYNLCGVNNDTFALLGCVLFFLGILRVCEEKRNYATYFLIAGGLVIAVLSKVTAGMLIGLTAIIYVIWYCIKPVSYTHLVDMVTVERQLNEMFASQAKAKNITLLFQRQYEEKYVFYLDTLRFNQIFINLIGNAIKFTRPGGTVIGRARLESFEKDIAYIRFSIEDTGIGIAPEAIERIFDSFEQGSAKTAQEYGGTGLGLTISSHLVQLMGGKLEVKSRLGEGSEFYFTLPLKFKYRTFGQTVLGEKKIENVSMDWKGKRLLAVSYTHLDVYKRQPQWW